MSNAPVATQLNKQDQAAGLRRIMAAPAPRVVTILSANSTHDKSRLMNNLAASIAGQGNKTLVVHASKASSESIYGINALPTLLDINTKKYALSKALHLSPYGFAIAKLMQKSQLHHNLGTDVFSNLSMLMQSLTNEYELVLVDASVDATGHLPLQMMADGEIIIQLTKKPASIKEAYALIKQLYGQLGRRSFGIVVDDATDAQAHVVFNNISKVAKQFMQIDLTYFGAIPKDEHLSKATQLGRSVVEAFPLAQASTAFKKLALQLEHKDFRHPRFDPRQQPSFQQAAFI